MSECCGKCGEELPSDNGKHFKVAIDSKQKEPTYDALNLIHQSLGYEPPAECKVCHACNTSIKNLARDIEHFKGSSHTLPKNKKRKIVWFSLFPFSFTLPNENKDYKEDWGGGVCVYCSPKSMENKQKTKIKIILTATRLRTSHRSISTMRP